MNIVLRLLLAEGKLSFDLFPQVACCNRTFYHECLPYQQLYDKYCWQHKIDRSHQIIIKVGQLFQCVSKGTETFASLCTRPLHYNHNSENKSYKIDLEAILQYSATITSKYVDYFCNEYYEGPDFEANPEYASQHTGPGWLSLSLTDVKHYNKWLNKDGLMLDSDNSDLCKCAHCKAYGKPPNKYCDCSKCSDPITGHSYWSKLSWPE